MIKKKEARTTYICPRCDRVYYDISREAWEADRNGQNEKAYEAKIKHQCFWKKRKQGGKK